MSKRILWLALTLALALTFVSGAVSQPPGERPEGGKKGKKGDGFGKKGDGFGKRDEVREVTADHFAARILAFDKTKSGKVTRDQLPERMQTLVDQGDTNADGALDREEIIALAAKLSQRKSFAGKGGPGGKGGKKGPGN